MSFSSSVVFAQQVNYDDVVTTSDSRPRDFEGFLVQLAWLNTAENRAAEGKMTIAEIEQEASKWNWVEDIGLSMNVNPTSNIITVNGNQFFQPGVTYGVSVNAGGILTSGFERKVAAEKVKIAEAGVHQQKLVVRSLVLRAYQRYLLAKEILISRSQAEEDAAAAYMVISELFKKNRAEVKDYTAASTTHFSAIEQRQTAEAEIQIAIIELEEIIGIEWEIAERYSISLGN